MPRSELVRVRVRDLAPGQRVRMPRTRALLTVVCVGEDEHGTYVVHTEDGAYPFDSDIELVDAEDDPASVRGWA